MWLQNRHQKILSLLQTRQQVSTDDLTQELAVSRETIRRDLMTLETDGLIRRVHGGAVLPDASPEEPFKKRMATHQREKIAIAKCAAALIQPGQRVFVDAGTTTSAFAMELAKIPDLSVVTNSFDIVSTMQRAESDAKVLLLGGRVLTDVPGTYGELTLSEISRFTADVAVISPVALHPEKGGGNYDLHEAEVARAMIAQSGGLIVLADQSKLCVTSQVQFCHCAQIDTLVTDAAADQQCLDRLERAGISRILKAS